VKALIVLVILFLFAPDSLLANQCAIRTAGYYNNSNGVFYHFATLVYDDSNLEFSVRISFCRHFAGCNAITWSMSLPVPQSGTIVGLNVRDDGGSYSPHPQVLLSYADGKSYMAIGYITCNFDDFCNCSIVPPSGWTLVHDFGLDCAGGSSGVEPTEQVPGLPRLNNYPNPFSNSTQLSFEIQKSDDAVITIYNVAGQRICNIERKNLTAGWHSFLWDGQDDSGKKLASGTYFYTVQTSMGNSTRKIILLK
jgi:hypothetical protein